MWPFAKELLYRGLQRALANGSSTQISMLLLGFGVLVLSFLFTVALEWFTQRRDFASFKTALKSWKSWLGAFLGLFTAWLLLFVFSTFTVIYGDHQELLAAKHKTCPAPQPPTVPAKLTPGAPSPRMRPSERQPARTVSANPLDTPLLHAVQEDLTSNDTNFLYEKRVTVNAKESTSPFNLVLTFDPSFYASGSPFTCTVSGVSIVSATAGARSTTQYSYSVQSPPVGPQNPVICHFWSKVPFQLVKADLDR
jgi:hypothetical protein